MGGLCRDIEAARSSYFVGCGQAIIVGLRSLPSLLLPLQRLLQLRHAQRVAPLAGYAHVAGVLFQAALLAEVRLLERQLELAAESRHLPGVLGA